jgi:hypothetical protein
MIVIIGVGAQHAAKVRGAEDKQVVGAFTAEGPDQAFDMAVHPRRMRLDWTVTYAHGADAAPEARAISAVVVTQEVGRGAVPRKSLGDLLREPTGGRLIGDLSPKDLSAAMAQNHENVEALERDRGDAEEINCGDGVGVAKLKDRSICPSFKQNVPYLFCIC